MQDENGQTARVEAEKPRGAARRVKRAVDGLLLLDKPGGMTSTAALARVRWLFKAKKAGHTGTLDPLATGLLPLAFGEAAKFSSFLLDADKVYEAEGLLGVETDSADAEGQVVATHEVGDAPSRLDTVLSGFIGTIEQVPPRFSAIRVAGRRLYEYARAGQEVAVPVRRVRVLSLELLEVTGPRFRVRVRCSKGTYIRSLIADIGRALGCGAHVTALRRTAVHGFDVTQALTMNALEDTAAEGMAALDRLLLPVDRMLASLPEVRLDAAAGRMLMHGQRVRLDAEDVFAGEVGESRNAPGSAGTDEAGLTISDRIKARDGTEPSDDDQAQSEIRVRINGPDGFLGVGRIEGQEIVPLRLISSGAAQRRDEPGAI